MTGILWAVIQSPLLIQRRYTLGKADHITLCQQTTTLLK